MLEATSNFDRHENVVFAYLDEPPFGFSSTDGQPSGCDVEVGLAILKSIGIHQIETRLVTFAELLPGVMQGQWTMNTAMFVTPERSKLVNFSRPVWALADGFIVKVGNPKGLISYESIAADPTAKLGVVRDTVQRQAALKAGMSIERIVELRTQQESIEALLTGAIDAFASTSIGNRVFFRRTNNARLAVVDLTSADLTKERAKPAFGAYSFAKTNGGLRQAFDAALKVYLGTAEHRVIMAQYGFTNVDIDLVMEQN